MTDVVHETEIGANGAEPEHDDTAPKAPTTHLDRLRQKRSEKVAERTLDLDIPGYDGELVCRYRALEWDELNKIGQRLESVKHPRRDFWALCDTLITACEGFFVRANGELEPLDPDAAEPVRYDNRLAEALGFPAQESARGAVLQAFGLAISPEVAVAAQQMELAQWMESATQEADKELLGES